MDNITPIHRDVNPLEPCVTVTKFRGFVESKHGDHEELWDQWCCVHHHWLNGAPAKSVIEAEIEALNHRADSKGLDRG